MGVQPLADVVMGFELDVVEGKIENCLMFLEYLIFESVDDRKLTHGLVVEGKLFAFKIAAMLILVV